MTIRLHEIHPTLVHVPLTLVPASVLMDTVGRLTNNERLMDAARMLMPVAAASAAITGATGLIAQGAVRAEGEARDLLLTHRNLNAALVAITTAMAVRRTRTERPGIGYLLAGLGGVMAMMYTAYLGGKMVYEHGVGVKPKGVQLDESPELRPRELRRATAKSFEHLRRQVRTSGEQIASGEIAPALRRRSRADGSGQGRANGGAAGLETHWIPGMSERAERDRREAQPSGDSEDRG